MKFFNWIHRPPQTLIVMRTEDMKLVHPQTDFSRKCSRCQAPVGIYPSGQAILRKRKRVLLVCNRCVDEGEVRKAWPASGSASEIGQSVRRQP